jgi:hypothetical protein
MNLQEERMWNYVLWSVVTQSNVTAKHRQKENLLKKKKNLFMASKFYNHLHKKLTVME